MINRQTVGISEEDPLGLNYEGDVNTTRSGPGFTDHWTVTADEWRCRMVYRIPIKDIPVKIGVPKVRMFQLFHGLVPTITFVEIRTMNPVDLGATLQIQERKGENFEILLKILFLNYFR